MRVKGAGGFKIRGLLHHREEGAVLLEENKRRCEGTFLDGVSNG